jgi:hypothetical protein
MWTITVDQLKVEQLRKNRWGGPDPFLPRRGAGDPYRIRMVDGRCFFLDADRRCRIHTQLGYDAKPEGCKAFPLHVATVGGETLLRLSFYCPAVRAGEGKRLSEQMRWIKATIKSAGSIARETPLQLDDSIALSARELEGIETALSTLLGDKERPMADRLAAGAALLGRLQLACGRAGKGALGPALEEARQADPQKLVEEVRGLGSAARAGPVLSLFLGQDCAPGSLSRLSHFVGVRLFNVGLTRLRSRMMGEVKASWRRIREVSFDPPLPAEANALLTRYLQHKLRARRPLTGELAFLAGYNLLVAAYGVINVLARLRAAAEGRNTCDANDVGEAVSAADLLVVEHTTLYHDTLVATLTDTVLSQDHLCASVLARLGRRA